MSVYYEKLVYTGPPRTGTTWVLNNLMACGIMPSKGDKGTVHRIDPVEFQTNCLRLVTIRDPCQWLLSYWVSIWPGKIGVPEVDALRSTAKLDTFADFAEFYLEHCPGAVGRMFAAYTKYADTIIKVEEQPYALQQVLDTAGYPANKFRHLRDARPINAAKSKPTWPRRLYLDACSAEKEFRDRYNY